MNTKIQAAILYPQLDSEQRQNEEEEKRRVIEQAYSNPSLAFFQKKKKKRARKKEKKIESENLAGWTQINTCCTRFMSDCFFLNISGIPDEPRY